MRKKRLGFVEVRFQPEWADGIRLGWPRWVLWVGLGLACWSWGLCGLNAATPKTLGLRFGAAAVDLTANDAMVIAGGITAGKVSGQEGKLRAVAYALQKDDVRLVIVACDVLMMTRETLDVARGEIARRTGIPTSHILVNCTHTHHAPSTMRVHDYGPDADFTRQVQQAVIESAVKAVGQIPVEEGYFYFHLGQENTVGQNSRMLMDDGMIYWIGPYTNVVRPTGPFDPELPVFAFRDARGALKALFFNHSTHSIGSRQPGKRSPSIYGLAAQDIEQEKGCLTAFLEGASGSTHNLKLTGAQCAERIRASVLDSVQQARIRPVYALAARQREFKYRVRHFDEQAEDAAVVRYCRKYAPAGAEVIRKVFANMRQDLADEQGQERSTWVQVLAIGDVAIVGVPAEYFTQLGLDIKNRSPFRYTYVAELANDWIGYLPNLEGHKLGGYQVWTGYHSYCEPGTGERIVDEAVSMLKEIAAETSSMSNPQP